MGRGSSIYSRGGLYIIFLLFCCQAILMARAFSPSKKALTTRLFVRFVIVTILGPASAPESGFSAFQIPIPAKRNKNTSKMPSRLSASVRNFRNCNGRENIAESGFLSIHAAEGHGQVFSPNGGGRDFTNFKRYDKMGTNQGGSVTLVFVKLVFSGLPCILVHMWKW